jgi:predicted AlkP superfamily phosphohydrolase/phosphomutase
MSFLRRKKTPRVLILGLDCASPDLVFGQFNADLPHLRRLMDGGIWGVLRSSIPCITVPAWASMTSSRDPGVLGVYGFRNRADWSYNTLKTADSNAIVVPRLWDVLSQANRPSLVVNVPQTYPTKPINGHLVTDFLTPNISSAFAYPAILRGEVLKLSPHYMFDVNDFRTPDKAHLLQRLYDFTETQYGVFEHLLKTKTWDFAMHVNMGIDRVHHGFWRYHDPQHRLYEAQNPYETAIHAYYCAVDAWLGRMLDALDDNTVVLVVSDHGVKRMDGAIAINEWLWRNGWLALRENPPIGTITKFDQLQIDWHHTKAWSTGGYYGRIFLNVQGREPHGTIAPYDYDAVIADLSAQLHTIPDNNGHALATQVFRPCDVYQQVNGYAPDMIVYFGDLHWRTVGGIGYGAHYTLENDTGPDDANHAEEGMFILYDPRQRAHGQISARQLMDIAPTVLEKLGIKIPKEMQGMAITAP